MNHRIVSILIPITLAACTPRYLAPPEGDGLGASRAYVDGTEEADLVLRAANELSLDELDLDAALDRRAAEGIVDLRPFVTIDELDAVPYVGESALDKLYDIAVDRFGSAAPPLTAAEEEALILQAANTQTLEVLDDDIGLDRRAAEGIVDVRPFATLVELDAVAYVGPAALDALLEFALATWSAPPSDCPAGLIVGSSGADYTDLGEAIRHSPTGTVLTLCDGRYELTGARIDRDLTLVGQGKGRSVVHATSGAAVEVVGADVIFRELTFADSSYIDGVVQVEWDATLTLDHTSFEDNGGQAVRVYRAELYLLAGNEFLRNSGTALYGHGYSTVVSAGTVFEDTDGTAVSLWDSTASFDGDRFHRNDGPEGAVHVDITWDSPWVMDFTDVDFGVGITENAGHDVVYARTNSSPGELDDLIADTDLHCFYDGCTEL